MSLWKKFNSWIINAFLVKDAEEFELWNDATVKIGIIEKTWWLKSRKITCSIFVKFATADLSVSFACVLSFDNLGLRQKGR